MTHNLSWERANKESRSAYKKELYQKHKARIAIKTTKWRREHPEIVMFRNAKYRAKRKGVVFTISVEDIQIPKVCPIFNIPLFQTPGKLSPNTPTLDRRDSSLGYEPGNVFVISHKANAAKSDLTKEQLKALYEYAV